MTKSSGTNLTRKIIEAHRKETSTPSVGEEIYLKMDQTLTHDITAVMGYLAFEALELPRVRTEKSVSYLDHNLLYVDNKTPDDHIYLQSIAKKFGLYLSRPGNGICHSLHYARFGIPGKTLLGTDSHTTTAGAIGMLGIGGGGMDAATAMAGVPIRLSMPQVINVHLTGSLPAGSSAKDVILEMLRRYSVKGGLGRIYEFTGPGVKTLEIPERATITNMCTELGATSGIFPADDITRKFFAAQGREKDFLLLGPDEDAYYDEVIEIDLSTLMPLVACPHQPDQVVSVKEVEKKPVHQVYIGSCTNASYADIRKAALVLKGKKVHEDVSLTVSVSTKQIFKLLLQEGIIEDLVDSGARITEIACGACCGIGQAPPTGGISVRTSNRNFKGRGGTADAYLYLVSPEVAAATAIAGFITEPGEVMENVEELKNVQEPAVYPVDDSMILPPLQDTSEIKIRRGPNIKPLPVNSPPRDILEATICLKTGDNISTDDITPASAELSSMRSNIPLIAEYAYSRYDKDFVKRAKEMGTSIIVGGENYGQGSSREHAAITPMFLGVKAVLAKSIARIHKNNLINHGVFPLIFEDPKDYEDMNLEDALSIKGFLDQIRDKKVLLHNRRSGKTITARLELTDNEVDILLHGGQLAYLKSQLTKEARE